jgi:hypothetical protein
LESSARINDTGYAKPVDFAHEVTRRVLLVFGREFWTLGQRSIKDCCVRLGDEKASRLSI